LVKSSLNKAQFVLAESFGQRLLAIFTALLAYYVEYTAKPLPCMNGQQFAVKTTLKDQ